MDELIKLEVNAETGEEVIRPYTQEEIDAYNEMLAAEQASKDAAAAQEAAKASAVAKLSALGLTSDEIASLFTNTQAGA